MHKLITVYNSLFNAYGPQLWWPVKGRDKRLEVMVGAILTQNTSWSNVEKAISNLLTEELLSISAILQAPKTKLATAVKPSGYYNQKALKLKFLANYLKATYNSDISNMAKVSTPQLREELLSIWGIGEETADSILLYALKRASFVIDAYTRRIFSRIGLTDKTATYSQIKDFFERNLPNQEALYNEYHALIVLHGKEVCKPKPLCEDCAIRFHCNYFGKK